jgi:hypothetical protein
MSGAIGIPEGLQLINAGLTHLAGRGAPRSGNACKGSKWAHAPIAVADRGMAVLEGARKATEDGDFLRETLRLLAQGRMEA